MRLSAATIRHRQRCRDQQKAKKNRRKNKVARDKQRQQLRTREARGLPPRESKHKKAKA